MGDMKNLFKVCPRCHCPVPDTHLPTCPNPTIEVKITSQELYDLETAILHHRREFPSGVVEILQKLTRQRVNRV